MPEHDEVAVVARIGRRLHRAISSRVNGLAFFRRDVDALVIAGLARERIATAAERTSQPAVRRPDRRGRRGELFAAFDVAPHEAEAAFKPVEQIAEHAKCVFRRVERGLRDIRKRAVCGARVCVGAAGRPRPHDRRELLHGARLRGIEHRPRAEVVDDVFERLNLTSQLAGRDAVAAVLNQQHGIGGEQFLDLGVRAPLGAKAHQHGNGQNGCHRQGEPSTVDRQLADNAARAVCDYHRIPTSWHWSPWKTALTTCNKRRWARKPTPSLATVSQGYTQPQALISGYDLSRSCPRHPYDGYRSWP